VTKDAREKDASDEPGKKAASVSKDDEAATSEADVSDSPRRMGRSASCSA
jgi:hypothetical protein